MGSNFKHGEVFLSKISKVSYIFTDPVKILYVAELIKVFKKINWLLIVVLGHNNESGKKNKDIYNYICIFSISVKYVQGVIWRLHLV